MQFYVFESTFNYYRALFRGDTADCAVYPAALLSGGCATARKRQSNPSNVRIFQDFFVFPFPAISRQSPPVYFEFSFNAHSPSFFGSGGPD